jgi:hypothetical protein
VTVAHTSDSNTRQTDGVTVTWAAIGNGVQGDAVAGPWTTVFFTITGTFGAAGSIVMQGSNDGTNWFALSAAALTAAGSVAPLGATEHPKYIRPAVTAGDGTTALTVVGFLQNRVGLT